MNEALIVASNRPSSVLEFTKQWKELIDFQDVSLIIMHDTEDEEETRQLCINFEKLFAGNGHATVFNHAMVKTDLGDRSWIIPRKTSACKSYGIYKAWEQGAKRIYVLDDDCYPLKDEIWLTNHRHNLNRKIANHVFLTINGIRPRGVPYMNNNEVMLSHGLWNGIPDVDAVTQLNGYNLQAYSGIHGTVPQGALFPFCGMNFGIRREAIPLMYFGLQGPDWGVDRYDDIWCGFLAKRVMDHLNWVVWTGSPYIHHTRLSNALVNLEKEANGYRMNCEFYNFAMNLDVIGGDAITCMKYVAARLIAWARHTSHFKEYFEKYGEAIMEWTSLFMEG